jgi:hypothetical protein
MKPVQKRKRGGQPKPASQRKRNNLTIRVLDHLRDRLETAARASQRSVSEEAAHRMTLGFNLQDELTDYARIREANDDTLAQLAEKRGWAKILDFQYGGFIFIPPGQVASKINELMEKALAAPTEKAAQQARAAPAEPVAQQAVEKSVTEALPPAMETAIQRAVERSLTEALPRAVEKSVAAALAGATLRIGGNGG